MQKSLINPLPNFFDTYIKIVEQEDLIKAFNESLETLNNLDINTLESIGDKTYQIGKWTTKDLFQHIIDNERIQSYRALRFARFDQTELPGFNENILAKKSNANKRTVEDLVSELKTVRHSTIQLFQSFDNTVLQNTGVCFNQKISVLALGFVIVGHQIHHLNVLDKKYFPLIKK